MIRAVFKRIVRPAFIRLRSVVIGLLEHREGIRTEGILHPEQLGFSSEYRTRYKPSAWFLLRRALPPRDVTSDDVFIDYGSGMGRVVFQAAAKYPFRRVIGVELSAELTEIARRNIERNRERLLCQDVTLVNSDALNYDLPDDVTVVYMYNPFKGPVFAGVLDRIETSLSRNPRRLRIIYFNPVEERQLLDAGFRVTRRLRGFRPGRDWSMSNSGCLYERHA